MAKEETVELEGVVNEVLPNTIFRVQLARAVIAARTSMEVTLS